MSGPTIRKVAGRRVWDSRGRPTVEAEVTLQGGASGRAIAPAGASTGSGEALDRRDGGSAFGGLDVRGAVDAVERVIAPALLGLDAADQALVDRTLIELDGTPDKTRLGANATVAVSMAVAHAAAAAAGVPLWRHLLPASHGPALPVPEIQIFGGGAHAGRRIDVQDFMVVCPGASSFAEALDWTAEVYRHAGLLMADAGKLKGVADEGGFWPEFGSNEEALSLLVRAIERAGRRPGEEVAISLDVAASELGRGGVYRLGLERKELDTGGMIDLLTGWLARYPIRMIEDPLAEDDAPGFAAFMSGAPAGILVVADDLAVTDAARVRDLAAGGAANALLIKPNQRGTLSEAREAWAAAREAGWSGIVSARSGESEDVTIVHLAVGWGAPFLKVGSFARSERMAKWNEGLRIEEALGQDARLARPAGWSRS
ncbi:MAG TPA: phosphopyruvate hydratase [Geminicoccaceae bacterium]